MKIYWYLIITAAAQGSMPQHYGLKARYSYNTCQEAACSNALRPVLPSTKNSQLKIGYWTSWHIRCGVAVYAEHVYNALRHAGHQVFMYPHTLTFDELIKQIRADKLNVLNIQYEPSLWHGPLRISRNKDGFIRGMQRLKSLGIKLVVTLHFEPNYVADIARIADALIYHKPPVYIKNNKKVHLIPMPVPVFNPQHNKLVLRKKYGFSAQDIILTTFGFLASGKEFAHNLARLIPWLRSNAHHRIQLLTSFNDNDLERSYREGDKIVALIAKHVLSKQVVYVTDFLVQQELSERLWISDLGYLWFNTDTASSSGASKEFIAARLPLIVNDSSHYHDITAGVIKTARNSARFIEAITRTIATPRADQLRKEMVLLYKALNYDTLITQHIALFEKLLDHR